MDCNNDLSILAMNSSLNANNKVKIIQNSTKSQCELNIAHNHEIMKPQVELEQFILRQWDSLREETVDDISFCSTFDDLSSVCSSLMDQDSEESIDYCCNNDNKNVISPESVNLPQDDGVQNELNEKKKSLFEPTPLKFIHHEFSHQQNDILSKKEQIKESLLSNDDNEQAIFQESRPSKRRCSMPSHFSYSSSVLENSQSKKNIEHDIKERNTYDHDSNDEMCDMTHSVQEKKHQHKEPSPNESHHHQDHKETVDLNSEAAFRKLQKMMLRSSVTQRALQTWDKKMGLPKNHCPTMIMTSKSRSKLQNEILMIAEFGEDYERTMPRRMTSPY